MPASVIKAIAAGRSNGAVGQKRAGCRSRQVRTVAMPAKAAKRPSPCLTTAANPRRRFHATHQAPARRPGPALLAVLLLPMTALADGAVQRGVNYLEPDSGLELSGIRSGPVCSDTDGPSGVCEAAQKIVITGQQRCEHAPGTVYPCTRFGYEFDYRGAEPGSTIDCTVKRQDPMGRRKTDPYTHKLDAASGRILYPTYRTHGPVDKRLIFSEVHRCSYQGQPLVNIEYIIYYEPDSPAAGASDAEVADAYFPEVPPACGQPFLSEDKARRLLDAVQVKPSAANEHLPQLQSQCLYSARGGPGRQVGYVYKFMLSDMFDVDKLDPMQVQFNATFASGGAELKQTRDEVGDRAFVFLKGDRTTLLVITGIKGRKDFAGRDQEFIANYYLDHPGLTHEQRAGMLIDVAEQDLDTWTAAAP